MSTDEPLGVDTIAHLEAEIARTFPTDAEAQYPLPPSKLPAHHYVDPEQYERELENVLLPGWYPVAPSSDVPAARDFVVVDRLQQSVVITRLDDGGMRAWHNVCERRDKPAWSRRWEFSASKE